MSAVRLGVLIPCRDESAVIGRKLANLARADWPDSEHPHLVVVVDDGSQDGTARIARAAGLEHPAVELRVVANRHGAGKAAAIAQGLEELDGAVDVVVLTDADVVVRPDALTTLARAFEREPELGMACGAQGFVHELADDGTCGAEPLPAAGIYDRLTARVRALESRGGRLFSVHGQLLAWRASLRLKAPLGIAADDLALMLQVRAARGRARLVRLVPGARFLERKPPPGEERERQALRRARAYFQVLWHASCPGGGALDRVQWLCYRWVPGIAPGLVAGAITVAVFLGWQRGGWRAALGLALLFIALRLTPIGRRVFRLLELIARARRGEEREPMSDRWEMRRT